MFFKNKKIKNLPAVVQLGRRVVRAEGVKAGQDGISILMVVLILSSLTIITIAMSDIVLRVAKSSRQIGQSEIAYYAAESAVEEALYQIEKERNLVDLDVATPQTLESSGGAWTRQTTLVNSYSTLCSQLGSQEGVCVDKSEPIGPSNPLEVQLDSGSSFQLELDFQGLTVSNNLNIKWPGSGSAKVIILNRIDNSQLLEESSPVIINNLDTNLYLIRIINTDIDQVTFSLKPSAQDLPISIQVTGTGTYQDEQRILEIERTNWQIY